MSMLDRAILPFLGVLLVLVLGFTQSELLSQQIVHNLALIQWQEEFLSAKTFDRSLPWLERLDQDDPSVRWALGSAYLAADRGEEARHVYDLPVAGAQMDQVVTYFQAAGNENEADLWKERIQSIGCRFSLLYEQAEQFFVKEEYASALAVYEQSLHVPTNECDWYGHSDAYYKMGWIWQRKMAPHDWEKAMTFLQQAITVDDFGHLKHKADTYFRMAEIMYARQDPDIERQLELTQQALHLDPAHLWAHYYLGLLTYRLSGDLDTATSHIQAGLRADPQNRSANSYLYTGLGDLYLAEGAPTEAEQYYRRALRLAPSNSQARERLQSITSP